MSLLRTENGLTAEIFVVKYIGRGLVVKRPGVLSKVQMLSLVLGVGVFSLLPIKGPSGGAEELRFKGVASVGSESTAQSQRCLQTALRDIASRQKLAHGESLS